MKIKGSPELVCLAVADDGDDVLAAVCSGYFLSAPLKISFSVSVSLHSDENQRNMFAAVSMTTEKSMHVQVRS